MNEPKDGDFVAYLEALQRESAARLGQQHISTQAAPAQPAAKDHLFESRKLDPRHEAQAVLERFLRRDGDALLVKPLVAAVVGITALLVWLERGGMFWLLVALVTLWYGIPRLVRAFRAFDLPKPNRAAIDQVFGKPGDKR
jgi:hypothetical protein